RAQLVPIVYRFFALNLIVFAALYRMPGTHAWVARAFFVWTSLFNLFVISLFWSLMADLFRKEQGTRLFGLVAAGGTLGAIAGPLVTFALVRWVGQAALMVLAAVLLELAVRAGRRLTSWAQTAGATGTVTVERARGDAVGGSIWAGVIRTAQVANLRRI